MRTGKDRSVQGPGAPSRRRRPKQTWKQRKGLFCSHRSALLSGTAGRPHGHSWEPPLWYGAGGAPMLERAGGPRGSTAWANATWTALCLRVFPDVPGNAYPLGGGASLSRLLQSQGLPVGGPLSNCASCWAPKGGLGLQGPVAHAAPWSCDSFLSTALSRESLSFIHLYSLAAGPEHGRPARGGSPAKSSR